MKSNNNIKIIKYHNILIIIIYLIILSFNTELYSFNLKHRNDNSFDFNINPLKTQYKKGEPIFFSIAGNKSFFLYIISSYYNSCNAKLIIPDSMDPLNQYMPSRDYIVPDKRFQFVADKAGKLNIVAIASSEKINFSFKKLINKNVFCYENLDDIEKTIKRHFFKHRNDFNKEIIIKLLEININSNNNRYQDKKIVISERFNRNDFEKFNSINNSHDKNRTAVFISSDKIEYKTNESIKLSYGADNAGFVYVYMINPDGKFRFLKKQKVNGNIFYQTDSYANNISGSYIFVAIYNRFGDINESRLFANGYQMQTNNFNGKKYPFARYNITIMH